jgi:hypothetical protein
VCLRQQIIVAVLFIRFEQTKEIEVKKEVFRKVIKRRERAVKVVHCSDCQNLASWLTLCVSLQRATMKARASQDALLAPSSPPSASPVRAPSFILLPCWALLTRSAASCS